MWGPRGLLDLGSGGLLGLGLDSQTSGLVHWILLGVAESCVRRLTPKLAQPEPGAPQKHSICRFAIAAWTQPVHEGAGRGYPGMSGPGLSKLTEVTAVTDTGLLGLSLPLGRPPTLLAMARGPCFLLGVSGPPLTVEPTGRAQPLVVSAAPSLACLVRSASTQVDGGLISQPVSLHWNLF